METSLTTRVAPPGAGWTELAPDVQVLGGVSVGPHREIWFGDARRPLHGWLTAPADGRATGGAVLCRPVGEEGRASHRTFRRLAERLAELGVVSLRFDYDGTGDSSGHPMDPDRVDAWLAGIAAAERVVRGTGVPSVAMVGMRIGATLAAVHLADTAAGTAAGIPADTAAGTSADTSAAAGRAPVDSLVLWDPVVSARRFLRESEALHAFGEGDEAGGTPDDGLRHTPGFQYTAETATGLRRIDLSKLPSTGLLADRLLLLERHDRPGAHADADRLAALTGDLERVEARDQDGLLDVRLTETRVPEASLEIVASWVAREPAPAVVLRLPSADADDRVAGGRVLVPSGRVGSPPVVEYGVRVGDVGCYGVVSEPVEPVRDGAPWVVLVNVAIEHHIGPGRRWTMIARQWAAQGYRVLRLDQSGVGDSPAHPGQRVDVLFAPQWIDDVPSVVTQLRAEGPVIAVGLCSGAYSALEAAQRVEIDSIFCVNPRLMLFEAPWGTPGYSRRRRAASNPYPPIAVLARKHSLAASYLWRTWRQVALRHAPYLFLDRTVRRGTVVEVIACPDDAKHFTEVPAWRPVMRRRIRSGRLRFERTDRLDHSLLGLGAQEYFTECATAFVEERHRVIAAREDQS